MRERPHQDPVQKLFYRIGCTSAAAGGASVLFGIINLAEKIPAASTADFVVNGLIIAGGAYVHTRVSEDFLIASHDDCPRARLRFEGRSKKYFPAVTSLALATAFPAVASLSNEGPAPEATEFIARAPIRHPDISFTEDATRASGNTIITFRQNPDEKDAISRGVAPR